MASRTGTGRSSRFSAGVEREAVPDDDALLSWWQKHHANLLRHARIGTPIPEAEQLDEAPRPPDRPPLGPVVLPLYSDPPLQDAMHEEGGLPLLAMASTPKAVSQTVFGEGPAHAKLLVVGRVARRPRRT